jgi:hypothetical protein
MPTFILIGCEAYRLEFEVKFLIYSGFVALKVRVVDSLRKFLSECH